MLVFVEDDTAADDDIAVSADPVGVVDVCIAAGNVGLVTEFVASGNPLISVCSKIFAPSLLYEIRKRILKGAYKKTKIIYK